MILPPAELDLTFELLMPQNLSTDSVAHGVLHHGLELALVALIPAPFSLGLLPRDLFEADDARNEAGGELLGVGAEDGP